MDSKYRVRRRSRLLRLWARKNWASIICYSAYVITYVTLSWAATPHVFDQFADSHTYLTVSFLGHAERLWTVPVVYFLGETSAGRVALQTLIGAACWVTLAIQFARVLRTRFIRRFAQALVLLVSLCPPIIQWNRTVLSESIAISLTVLLLAASLALARRMDLRALTAFLVVVVLWTFTRQVQAFIVIALAIPFLLLAWRRPQARQLALVGGTGVAVIGVWGTLTALQTSSASPTGIAATNPSEVQLAGIIQYRASTNVGELSYLYSHGLPRTSALTIPPPFTRVGQPVNVSQFADPFAEYRLADDPKFKHWADGSGEHVYLKYLISHPTTTLFQPIVDAAQLLTMNPDYISTPGLPSWASTAVYGNLSSLATPNTPSGAPRSSDPFYFVALCGVGSLLFCVAVVRHRLTRVIWVAAGAMLFGAVWSITIWNFAATELPREFVETAALFHVSILLLIAATLDSLISGGSETGEHQISREAMAGALPVPIQPTASPVETSSAPHYDAGTFKEILEMFMFSVKAPIDNLTGNQP
jgi:4-amino-4-deoxy-L-arabinose transferase-like glycosyltransferase